MAVPAVPLLPALLNKVGFPIKKGAGKSPAFKATIAVK